MEPKVKSNSSVHIAEEEPALTELAENMSSMLKVRSPRNVEGVPSELHPLPPFVGRNDWSVLGDAIKVAERPTSPIIPGNKWISLRCDGTGFSRLTHRLIKAGILPKGFSQELADIMSECCKELMEQFNAKCGYTQSDELTVLLGPRKLIRGEQDPHLYSGRVQKLCSLAAATVTARFNHDIMKLCSDRSIEWDVKYLATFDCRVGAYDTEQEAVSLLLWRAYDCGINAASDAVYKSGIDGARKVVKCPSDEKLQWLHRHSLLPLPRHQREGSFYVRRKRVMQCVNQKTLEETTCIRSRIELVEGNILSLHKTKKLFPAGETGG